jgi:serine/threonine protein kinase
VHATTPIAQIVYEKGGRNLNEAIETNSFCTILNGFRSIFAGLVQLQTLRVVHGDIKPANIVFDDAEGKAYLVDFGSAYVYEDIESQYDLMRNTYRYYPPEYKMIYNEQNKTRLPVLQGVEEFAAYIMSVMKGPKMKIIAEVALEIQSILKPKINKLPTKYDDPSKFDLYALGITLLEMFVYRHDVVAVQVRIAQEEALLDPAFMLDFLKLVESMICRSDDRPKPYVIKCKYLALLRNHKKYFPVPVPAPAKIPDYVIAVHFTSAATSTLDALRERKISANKIIVFMKNGDQATLHKTLDVYYTVINLPDIDEKTIKMCFSKDTPIILMANTVTDTDLVGETNGNLDEFYTKKANEELAAHQQERSKHMFIRPKM